MDETTDNPVIIRKGRRLPPPRPGVRHVSIFLIPIVVISNDDLRSKINRRFHWPMITLALLMLPLLGVEFFIRPVTGTLLWWANMAGLFLIWLAFFIEFVVKITIAECRIEYAKRNWLDILIILLPALRPLRAHAAVTRTSRVFRLRGVGMKLAKYLFTALLGLEATDRILHKVGVKKDQTKRKHPDEMTRFQLSRELKQLRKLTDDWEQWYAMHMEHLDEQGVSLYEVECPALEDDRDASDELSDAKAAPAESKPSEDPTMPPTCESPSPN